MRDLLLWTLGGGLLLLAVFQLVRRGRGTRPDVRLPATAPPPGLSPSAEDGAPTVDLPDRLAAEGRYAEAVHALLQDSIAFLTARGPLDPSLTSREVAHAFAREEAVHEALAGIVRAVEVSRFGRRPLGPEEYRSCRAHRDRLGDLLSRRVAGARDAG